MNAATITTPADAPTALAFLEYVHHHAITAGISGRVVISAKQPPSDDPLAAKYHSWSYRLDQLGKAAHHAGQISDGGLSVFIRVHLISRDLAKKTERGRSADTSVITHYAADVDYGTAGHASGELPPDATAALDIVDATLKPSAIISSGGGLYPIWRLSEPFTITTDEDRQRVKNVGRQLDRALQLNAKPYHVDATCLDLTRVIRPPGVMNHKTGRDPRPVTVARGWLEGAGDYSLADLERTLPPLPVAEPIKPKPARITTEGPSTAPWDILNERYDLEDILAADPLQDWERVHDVADGSGQMVPAWRYVGSSADYSIKAGSGGAVIVWSSTVAARLGIEPGSGISRWALLAAFAGLNPSIAARWSR